LTTQEEGMSQHAGAEATEAPEGWKNYEDFAGGIATNRLPRTDALAGTELTVALADGTTLDLAFRDPASLDWHELGGPAAGGGSGDWYEAVEVDDGAYFVDITFASRPSEALTLIVSLPTRRALSIRSTVADEPTPGVPRVGQVFLAGTLEGDEAPSGEVPAPSRDLIGRRALYRYSPNHLYEHTYLSSERYCWQCLEGVQRGHGDVDLATTYRFAEQRYLFTFREFRIPVASVFFFNLDTACSTGKFLGVTGDGRIENSPAGAHIIPLSQATYPDGVAPV